MSERTLRRHFDRLLSNSLSPIQLLAPKQIFLKLDAQYISNTSCIILGKTDKEVIYWKSFDRESFLNYLTVLKDVRKLGYNVLGVTSDWHGSLVSAIKYLYPNIPHQRCLIHTQRRCSSLLTLHPKTQAGKDLREILSFLNHIVNEYEAHIWITWLNRWEARYTSMIKERTHGQKDDGTNTWWYTHKNLRKAFRTLESSIDNIFLYLKFEGLDKDTNGLESEFSHLKQKISMHRGLKLERKLSAIYWYIYFVKQRRN